MARNMVLQRVIIAMTTLHLANAITVHHPLSLQHPTPVHLPSLSHSRTASRPQFARFVHLQQIPQQSQQSVIATLHYPATLPVASLDTRQYPELKTIAILQQYQPLDKQFPARNEPIGKHPAAEIQPIVKAYQEQGKPISIAEHLADLNKKAVAAETPKKLYKARKSKRRKVSAQQQASDADVGLDGVATVKLPAKKSFGRLESSTGSQQLPLAAIDTLYASIDHLSAPSGRQLQHSAAYQSAPSASDQHNHKGASAKGQEGHEDDHSSHGGHKHKGGAATHHKASANKGASGKESDKKHFEEDGGDKHTEHESGGGGGSHDHQEGGASSGRFKGGGARNKGDFVKGYRAKYGKNEFHKSDKFWKDGHEAGDFQKFGKEGSSHFKFGAAKKKGASKQRGESGAAKGKKGATEGGHDHAEHKGHKGEHGHEEVSGGEAEYAKKGGSQSHKQYKTR